jgi:hypothetical protein
VWVKVGGLPYIGHYGFPMNATLIGRGGLENPQGRWFLLSNTWPSEPAPTVGTFTFLSGVS